jgi:hypothetical protein
MASARSSISFKWLVFSLSLLFVFFAFPTFVFAAAVFVALLIAVLSFFAATAAFFFADSTFLRAVSFLFVFLIASVFFSLF